MNKKIYKGSKCEKEMLMYKIMTFKKERRVAVSQRVLNVIQIVPLPLSNIKT